jgi:hypothetical protein
MSNMIQGRTQTLDTLRQTLLQALSSGVRELWCADPDFADWPLNELSFIEALTQWSEPHRCLHLVAQHYDEMLRSHPRFVQWRRDFSHAVEAWCAAKTEAARHPCVLVAGERSFEILDRVHWRAVISDEPADALSRRERLDAILQHSSPGFAATTLGL